jgi:hypothetical protein
MKKERRDGNEEGICDEGTGERNARRETNEGNSLTADQRERGK